MNKFCILFAGPIGSGKSPISNYLSYKLNIPIFNNDIIRTEVKEDLLKMDEEEYERRRAMRTQEIIKSEISFIYDASIDRKWEQYKQALVNSGYTFFIISLDFSKNKLLQIYNAKGYDAFDALDRTFDDHKAFLEKFKNDVSFNLTDNDFSDRLQIAFENLQDLIK